MGTLPGPANLASKEPVPGMRVATGTMACNKKNRDEATWASVPHPLSNCKGSTPTLWQLSSRD